MRFRSVFKFPFIVFLVAFMPGFAGSSVRVDEFKWMVVQTEHFDIYYDESTEQLVPRMAHYLEKAWKEVGEIYNFQVPDRTPFFFFSNHNEFEQTNVVPIGEGTGGVTEAFKNRFLIFNDGSEEWLRHVIYHEFTHVVQFNVLYGGFWRSIRLLKSPFYPLWMMEGTAEVGSGDIDAATGDMVVRDAVASGTLMDLAELHGFSHLKPNQVTLGYKTGEAAIDFMREEYGADKLPKFIVAMKDHFDVSSALEEIIGTDLDRFNFRFHEWIKDKYDAFLKRAKPPTEYGVKLTDSDGIPQFNEAPALSPDGKTLYYFSDKGGPTQLFKKDLVTNKAKPILKLDYSMYENLHPQRRALSLSLDGKTLAFAGEKIQRDYLYLFDVEREKLKRVKIPFDELRAPVFSPVVADQLVVVGMKRGFNDLYLIDTKGRIVKRLTDTPQDERDPAFTPNGFKVIFSGEILTDDFSMPNGRDLFSIDLVTSEVKRLTNHAGTSQEPAVMPDGSIIYVRDRDLNGNVGFNLYRLDSENATPVALTDAIGGMFSPVYSKGDQKLYFVAFHQGERQVYRSTVSFEKPIQVTEVEAEPVPVETVVMDSTSAVQPDVEDTLTLGDPPVLAKGGTPFVTWPTSMNSPLLVTQPQKYRFKGSTDLFLPFFFYSTLDGLVIADIWQASDMLGNHQVQQQMQYASGSDYIDFAMFYTYARYRPQLTLGLRTVKYYRDVDEQEQRRETTGIAAVSYPLDRVSGLTLGFGATQRKDVFLDNIEPASRFQERFILSAYQYDTVTGRYLVPTKGRRFQLFYQEGIDSMGGREQYRTGGTELTQYVPLPRESTFATRFFYGRSVGDEPQVFRLGGVDRIRAIPSGSLEFKKSNVAYGSAEMRFRLKYLNARTKFLFPDFFFKAAYLIIFDDMGYGWNNDTERHNFDRQSLENTAGVGISWPTFILQSFQLNLTVQWAKRTTNGGEVWYVTVGPSF